MDVTCEKGFIRINDLVGGAGGTGNFGAYESPFVGAGEFVQGDITGKETVVEVKKVDQVQELVRDFVKCVETIRAGGKPDPDWPHRSLAVHSVMCAVVQSANSRDGDAFAVVQPANIK